MYKYDYLEEMKNDIAFYCQDNGIDIKSYKEEPENLVDELWDVDCITGNGPYGYADAHECAQFLTYNLELAREALEEFETTKIPRDKDLYKYLDTTIRCYLLHQAVYELVDAEEEED